MDESNTRRTHEVQPEPLLRWSVPALNGAQEVEIVAAPGRVVVLVGANGAGKSALAYWLSAHPPTNAHPIIRIVAHRRVWLASSGPDITATHRESMDMNHQSWDSVARSRVYIEGDNQRASKILFDLLGRVNHRNASVAKSVDNKTLDPQNVPESLLIAIGRVMHKAGLNLSFDLTDNGSIDAVRDDVAYPLAEMSDGEKGAFMLAAQVLLADRGSVLIIDEPERHLHRSISAVFIKSLLEERSDSAFILTTHDLELFNRLDPDAVTAGLINSVSWESQEVTGWDIKVIEDWRGEVPELARQAILGGRSSLLFVEGREDGTDAEIYRALYPNWSVIACGSWEDVCRAVYGLQASAPFHWVRGHGIIDGDARKEAQVRSLSEKGITVLPVNEVESLHYLKEIVEAVAQQQAGLIKIDAKVTEASATTGALESLNAANVVHLAATNAAKILRREILAMAPAAEEIALKGPELTFSISSPYEDEHAALLDLIRAKDYDGVITRYSVRDSPLLPRVAKRLRFPDRETFEMRVRVLLSGQVALAERVRNRIGWDGIN